MGERTEKFIFHLGSGIFLCLFTVAVNSLQTISHELADLHAKMAVIVEKIEQHSSELAMHQAKIEHLEFKRH